MDKPNAHAEGEELEPEDFSDLLTRHKSRRVREIDRALKKLLKREGAINERGREQPE